MGLVDDNGLPLLTTLWRYATRKSNRWQPITAPPLLLVPSSLERLTVGVQPANRSTISFQSQRRVEGLHVVWNGPLSMFPADLTIPFVHWSANVRDDHPDVDSCR
jgi:hypothetical protein